MARRKRHALSYAKNPETWHYAVGGLVVFGVVGLVAYSASSQPKPKSGPGGCNYLVWKTLMEEPTWSEIDKYYDPWCITGMPKHDRVVNTQILIGQSECVNPQADVGMVAKFMDMDLDPKANWVLEKGTPGATHCHTVPLSFRPKTQF